MKLGEVDNSRFEETTTAFTSTLIRRYYLSSVKLINCGINTLCRSSGIDEVEVYNGFYNYTLFMKLNANFGKISGETSSLKTL